jgi:hypothetical protein
MQIQTTHPIIQHSSQPTEFMKHPEFPPYWWPGSAASANILDLAAHRFDPNKLVLAAWSVAWNPRAPAPYKAGIQLVRFYAGESDLQVIKTLEDTYDGPKTTGDYPTEQIRQMIIDSKVNGTWMQVGHRAMTTGPLGPLIYKSVLNLVWDLG